MYISLSNPTLPGTPINQVKTPSENLVGYELGGVGIQNPDQGLMVQLWTVTTDGSNIYLSAPNQAPFVLLSDLNISDVDLAFDQNMFPFVAYTSNGLVKFYWYDDTIPAFVTSTLLTLAISPRCTLDDKRPQDISNSDILLTYINLSTMNLCYRAQRDRYNIEYVLQSVSNLNWRIQYINFSTVDRVQLVLNDLTPDITSATHDGLVNFTRPISITGAYIT
jgi:hypothetical protein